MNILISESQFLVAEGLKSVLNGTDLYIVSGIADTYSELKKLLQSESPDILILDIQILENTAFADYKTIAEHYPGIAVLLLTNPLTKSEITGWIRAGFKNIIYKSADKDEVLTAVESALKGKKFYSDEILDLMFEEKNTGIEPVILNQLTASETEIVRFIASGLTTKEIAAKKNVSFHTVNTHRKNIFRKLEVSNSSELIILAIKAGWIDNIEYYI